MSYRARANAEVCALVSMRVKAVITVAMMAAALMFGASRGHGAESWRILLTHQLKEQQRCDLAEVLFVREVKVGGRVGLEGRARCTDTREYDFTRERDNQRFRLRLCEPVAVC